MLNRILELVGLQEPPPERRIDREIGDDDVLRCISFHEWRNNATIRERVVRAYLPSKTPEEVIRECKTRVIVVVVFSLNDLEEEGVIVRKTWAELSLEEQEALYTKMTDIQRKALGKGYSNDWYKRIGGGTRDRFRSIIDTKVGALVPSS